MYILKCMTHVRVSEINRRKTIAFELTIAVLFELCKNKLSSRRKLVNRSLLPRSLQGCNGIKSEPN